MTGPFCALWSTNDPLLGRHPDHPYARDIEVAHNVWDGHCEMPKTTKADATNYFCRSIRIHDNRQYSNNAPTFMFYAGGTKDEP